MKYQEQVTYNFASSLGAAIRNALTPDVVEAGYSDAETAGERLTSLLKRMQELKQYDQELITHVLVSMLHQSGDLHHLADYCRDHKETHLEVAQKVYKRYAEALKKEHLEDAKRHASVYNFFLKEAGGPEKNKGEFYLSMGKEA